MKKTIAIILILISFNVAGQRKDSLPPNVTTGVPAVTVKMDSVITVLNNLSQFAYDKVSAKDFDTLNKLMEAYVQQYLATKPKKPK